MAKNVLLNTKALGSVVIVRENGAAAEFVVGAKNYESGVNSGIKQNYTLLIRKAVLSDRVKWANSVDATTDLEWGRDSCTLRKWLESTYYARLSSAVKNQMETINYQTRQGTYSYTTVKGKVAVLGAEDYYSTTSGRALDKTVLDALTKAPSSTHYSGNEWTRNLGNSKMEEDGMSNYYFTRVMLAFYADANGWNYQNRWVVQESGYPDASMASTGYIRPCFVLNADTRVTPEGELVANSAPTIESFYANGGDMGAKNKAFAFDYVIRDADEDTVTVTCEIAGTMLSTNRFEASAAGTKWTFRLSDTVWNALDWDQYYELKITVTDGYAANSWTSRFLKTQKKGYRIYAGTIANSVNGTTIASGSYTFDTLECIYDPTADDAGRMVFDPELNLQKNDFGSLELTLPKQNLYYDKVTAKKTVLLVEEDGGELWTGYVSELSKNFKMEKVLYCDGEMGYLQDISMRLEAKEWTAADLFTAAVNATANAGIKSFRVGTISEAFKTEKVSTKDSGAQYTTVWGVLNDILLQKTGGILRLRKRRDKTTTYGTGYTRYLDFLVDITETTDQVIQYGRNLLDLEYTIKAQDLVNRVVVYGYSTSGFWFWKNTNLIHTVVENTESVKKYGACERCILVEGTSSTEADLKAVGEKYMNENGTPNPTGSFTINALDLRDAGVDVGRLCFLKRTRVMSDPHGIFDKPLCSSIRIPLDEPESKEFTFGETVQSFTQKQASTSAVAKRASETLDSVIGYISATG